MNVGWLVNVHKIRVFEVHEFNPSEVIRIFREDYVASS